MKVKELISKLQEFDGEMEVIIKRYDGIKSHNDLMTCDDISFGENVRQSGYGTDESRKIISRAIIIEG